MKKSAKKKSKKRAVKQQQIIVLVDGDKRYYELPRAVLERSRVSKSREKKLVARLEDKDSEFTYIGLANIPGGTADAPKFSGGRRLHYGGFYISSSKAKS
jgi:hypothetical protein